MKYIVKTKTQFMGNCLKLREPNQSSSPVTKFRNSLTPIDQIKNKRDEEIFYNEHIATRQPFRPQYRHVETIITIKLPQMYKKK